MTARDLRRIRLALGLTQVEMGERMGVTSNTIARWERGEVGVHPTASKLLELLDPHETQTARRRARTRRRA